MFVIRNNKTNNYVWYDDGGNNGDPTIWEDDHILPLGKYKYKDRAELHLEILNNIGKATKDTYRIEEL